MSSSPSTTLPVIPVVVNGGRTERRPRCTRAMSAGLLMTTFGRGAVCVEHLSAEEDGVREVGAEAVQQVDRLAPDVRVRLVQCARLPLVDEVVRVLRVRVAPLVCDDVVGRDAVAVVRRCAVPVGVRAVDGRVVVDRLHLRARAVVGIPPEGVAEEPVRIAAESDDVLLIDVERAGVHRLPATPGSRCSARRGAGRAIRRSSSSG